jgi:hypothetical protein
MNLEKIKVEQFRLSNHPLFAVANVRTQEQLQMFMKSHVYAVWDFMSLLKSLQNAVVPSTVPWVPTNAKRTNSARLINEIILCEETDEYLGHSISHFDLYCQSMFEIGADIVPVQKFIDMVSMSGVARALELECVPDESKAFVKSTFDIINRGKAHEIAAAFCFGRETIITNMFRGLLTQLEIPQDQAPRFYHYLERHIEIDGDEHGPASLELIRLLCDNDPIKIIEAENAAIRAIHARIDLWSGILNRLPK